MTGIGFLLAAAVVVACCRFWVRHGDETAAVWVEYCVRLALRHPTGWHRYSIFADTRHILQAEQRRAARLVWKLAMAGQVLLAVVLLLAAVVAFTR